MERVNRTLRRKGIEGLFGTLAYALFDFQDRSLRLANSGLPHPLHYRAALGRAVPLEVSGLPLGTFDGVVYDELRAALEPGDAFVFYSDGVIEARSGKEEPRRSERAWSATSSSSLEPRARTTTSPLSSSRYCKYAPCRKYQGRELNHTDPGGPRYTDCFG